MAAFVTIFFNALTLRLPLMIRSFKCSWKISFVLTLILSNFSLKPFFYFRISYSYIFLILFISKKVNLLILLLFAYQRAIWRHVIIWITSKIVFILHEKRSHRKILNNKGPRIDTCRALKQHFPARTGLILNKRQIKGLWWCKLVLTLFNRNMMFYVVTSFDHIFSIDISHL